MTQKSSSRVGSSKKSSSARKGGVRKDINTMEDDIEDNEDLEIDIGIPAVRISTNNPVMV